MKHQITSEMLQQFKEMLKSKDSGDCKLALDILYNRDIDDETEKNFNEIKKLIIDNDELFPHDEEETWVIKAGGKTLTMNSGKSSWASEGNANKALSNHLGRYFKYNSYRNSYFKMIKTIFGDVGTFRKFLIDNKIIEIVKIDG